MDLWPTYTGGINKVSSRHIQKMTDSTPAQHLIQKLHQLYRELTGRDEQLNMGTEYDWHQWLALLQHRPEWQPENMLRLVIAYRLSEIRSGRRHPASLAFRNMIRDIAQADDLIADALAARRKQAPKMSEGKADVMRATGRPTDLPQSEAKPVGEVISRMEFAEKLKAWKEANL